MVDKVSQAMPVYPVVPDGAGGFITQTGGGGGGGGTTTTATNANPTYTEGSTTAPLSVDLTGQLRVKDQSADAALATIASAVTDTTPSHVIVDSGTINVPLAANAATADNQTIQNSNTTSIAAAAGAPADVAVTATDTTPGTLVGLAKGFISRINALITALGTPLQAGGNVAVTSGLITIQGTGGTISSGSVAADGTSTSGVVAAVTRASGYFYNVATSNWDRAKKPGASGTSRIVSSAATTNATAGPTGLRDVFGVDAYNTTSTVKFLKLYNKASAPTVGTDTPVVTIALTPNARTSMAWSNGLCFTTGVAYALTGAAADSDTTALAAGDVVGVNVYVSA